MCADTAVLAPPGGLANPFLDAVAQKLRRARPLIRSRHDHLYRIDHLPGGRMAQLWFITAGCTHDACTMCDYGKGPRVRGADMVAAVHRGLAELDLAALAYLEVSPSGSMLDPAEVPPAARRAIFQTVSTTPVPHVLFETRAETVSTEVLAAVRYELGDKSIGVMVGLESANPWVQRYAVNKRSHPRLFARAAAALREAGMEVIANISLGTAFLSPAEAINDAVAAVRWALGNGADWAVLYPLQAKRHTVLAELFALGRYRSPSLWALVAALGRLAPDEVARTSIAWYRNYYEEPFVDTVTSCPACASALLAGLDRFHATQSLAVVAELSASRCRCKASWEQTVVPPPLSPMTRVSEGYQALAVALGLEDWWRRNPGFLDELERDFVPIGVTG
jgi:hypothetical protein